VESYQSRGALRKPGNIVPAHGVPDDRSGILADLLDEARRLRDLGHSPDEVRRAILTLNRNLRDLAVPPYSPGGLAECLNIVVAESPGGGA
jgi:hypothetical protein